MCTFPSRESEKKSKLTQPKRRYSSLLERRGGKIKTQGGVIKKRPEREE